VVAGGGPTVLTSPGVQISLNKVVVKELDTGKAAAGVFGVRAVPSGSLLEVAEEGHRRVLGVRRGGMGGEPMVKFLRSEKCSPASRRRC